MQRHHGALEIAGGHCRPRVERIVDRLHHRAAFRGPRRLRIGIGHPRDSAIPQQDVVDYVLQPPRTAERTAILKAIDEALDAWPAIATGDFERAMMALHTRKEQENP